MIISGYDCWKRKGLSQRQKLESVGAETTSLGSPFQIWGPETLKVRLPTLDSRNIGTIRRLELAVYCVFRTDWCLSVCLRVSLLNWSFFWFVLMWAGYYRPCRSATRSSGPRYRGAVSCRTLYISTAILYWMRSGTRSQCRLTRASVMWSGVILYEAPVHLRDSLGCTGTDCCVDSDVLLTWCYLPFVVVC